jgi:bifunctional DNA-binding transcriptional regulator/antitoxin component of YhaV-PrlF toxin-antitoxin module
MTSKTVLGDDCKLWQNFTAYVPYEVAEKLGMRPGDRFRYVEYGGRIEIEKVMK